MGISPGLLGNYANPDESFPVSRLQSLTRRRWRRIGTRFATISLESSGSHSGLRAEYFLLIGLLE
jgi:hypothetical protein